MGILEKFKRRFGMAKRFKGGIKEDIVKEVDKIAQRVAEEEREEGLLNKSKLDFLKSKGLDARPNSHRAITAWEEYLASCTD